MTIAIFALITAAQAAILALPLADIPPAAAFAYGTAHTAVWAWLLMWEVRR